MPYAKTNWVDNATLLNAINLNNIEGGISDNETNLNTANTALVLKAPLISPNFTGTPTVPTAVANTDNLQIANTTFVMIQAPAGQVSHFAMATAPAGWLKANGALVDRVTYARLFTAIGTLYGAGDGSTTFQLPDLRGQFIRGLDNGAGVDPVRVMGSKQEDAFESHEHPLNIYLDHTGVGTLQGILAQMDVLDVGTPYIAANNGGTETRPKNVALLACIRY